MKEYTIVWCVNEYLSDKSLCAHPRINLAGFPWLCKGKWIKRL